jgi:uncharacterized lipoprotein NlpE involved in copper resistance
MLKVTSSVELAYSGSYVGWNCESIEFRDSQGNSVKVTLNAEQARQLAKQLTERYQTWLKDQADKAEKTKTEA